MNRPPILLLAMFVNLCTVHAQYPATKNPGWTSHFHSFNTVQVLNGSTTTSVAINSVNGFQSEKFFTGLGTGLDYYYHVSVPLFLEARLDILKRKGTLQLFGNVGMNFPFSSQNKNLEYKTGNYKTGSFYGVGLDYLPRAGKDGFIIGAAFSYKRVIQLADNNVWNPVLNRNEPFPIRDEYALNRIAVRVGWRF